MADSSLVISRVSQLRKLQQRARGLRLPWIALSVLALLVACALFAPFLALHNPTDINMLEAKIAPAKSLSHPLGTDILGRDMLSRLIYGARSAMFMIVVALGSGALVGTVLGLISGYRGGWVDSLIMRLVDAVMGFPTILVAMLIVVLLGTGTVNIILAVALTVWAHFARMIRGEVLSIKELDFVTLAIIAGVGAPAIIWRHIFPNTVNVLMITTSLRVGQVILLEASLSFLGLGLPPGHPAWGIMVSEGKVAILELWWLALFPGLAITFVVLAFNFFGDWMRDSLDPKLRRI